MKHWNKISLFLTAVLVYAAHSSGLFQDLGESDSRVAAGIFAQIAATMLGFLVAALSILASISGHRLLRNMQRSGHYRVLLRGFFLNATAYAVAMLAAFFALVFKLHFPVAPLVALACFTYATLLLADVGWKLWLVLHNLTPD